MFDTDTGLFSPDQQRLFEQYEAALYAHGYFVPAEPISGMEDVFLADVGDALEKVEETAAYLRRQYRYRGLSKNLLRELAIRLPAPSFNVENWVKAEIEAQERRSRAA